MSLKAGRVGVSPNEVDELGHIKNGGAGGDSYTKEEADNKFAKKTNLTANNKEFQFAYDSETDSYGYKAGGADTFHPFKAGGVSEAGIYVTDNATLTGVSFNDYVEFIEGGVETNNNFNYQNYSDDYVTFVRLKCKAKQDLQANTNIGTISMNKSRRFWAGKNALVYESNIRTSVNISAGTICELIIIYSEY